MGNISKLSRNEQERIDGDLMQAAATLDVRGIKLALDEGANANAQEISGKGPLHLVMQTFPGSDSVKIRMLKQCVQLLVNAGADCEARDGIGNRPIHDALMQMNEPGLMALVESGADVNARGHGGSTPLHYAVGMYGSTGPCRVLLAAGADIDVMSDGPHPRTPIQTALMSNAAENAELLQEIQNYPTMRPTSYRNADTGETLDLAKRAHSLKAMAKPLVKDAGTPTQTLELKSLQHDGKQTLGSRAQLFLN